jgi:hypothetical protein
VQACLCWSISSADSCTPMVSNLCVSTHTLILFYWSSLATHEHMANCHEISVNNIGEVELGSVAQV